VSNIVERARLFATAAHAAVSQTRKYTGEPYIVHPIAVAELVRSVSDTPEMLAAALLRDVVEDTGVTLELIEQEFGAEARELVFWLSDISRPEDGTRKVRKAIDRAHTAKAPASAKTIKVADLIDNSRTLFVHDKKFARVYMGELEALLDVLTEADPKLLRMAKDQLEAYTEIIY
jgi:(p)ppGpp synthase/HD superfamily hydrolase